MIRPRLFVIVLAFAACNRSDPEGRFAQAGSEEPAPPTGPLRYGTTIEAARRPGDTVTTLVEVASPATGRMRALVAVIRPASAPASGDVMAVEIWTFDQRNDGGVLTMVGAPTPALRLRAADPSAPELADLRFEAAAPSAEVHRVLGVAAANPAAALAAMEMAAKSVRDEGLAASDRLAALVVVVRGLDDGPLLEQDALGRALDELVAGAWSAQSAAALSDRRAEITTKSGAVLELHRKGDGWVVASKI